MKRSIISTSIASLFAIIHIVPHLIQFITSDICVKQFDFFSLILMMLNIVILIFFIWLKRIGWMLLVGLSIIWTVTFIYSAFTLLFFTSFNTLLNNAYFYITHLFSNFGIDNVHLYTISPVLLKGLITSFGSCVILCLSFTKSIRSLFLIQTIEIVKTIIISCILIILFFIVLQ